MRHDHPDPLDGMHNAAAFWDRRGAQRCMSARPIPRRIYRVEDFQPLDAWIVDVSCGGVALLLSEPLESGVTLFIELESLPEAPPVKVWASVVRSVPADSGDWLVGCELVNCLSERALGTLLV
jgi:hypothetical protein